MEAHFHHKKKVIHDENKHTHGDKQYETLSQQFDLGH